MSLLWNLASRSTRLIAWSYNVSGRGGVGSKLLTPSMFQPCASSMASSLFTMSSLLRFKSGVKTTGGVKKRVRLRGSGSIKRWKSGKSHNTGYKKRQRVNRLGSSTGVEGKGHEQRIRKLLGCLHA